LLSAALKLALLVFRPFVLNTGLLPEVVAVGSLTPFSRIHDENFASVLLEFAPPKPARAPAGKLPPPHFFSAACSCVVLSPFGSLNPPPGRCALEPVGGADELGPASADAEGSVMPCFARHERSAADVADPAPLPAGVADLPADVAELLPPEDPPHAARARLQQRRSARPTSGALGWAVGRRRGGSEGTYSSVSMVVLLV
jgi:hypothetical protein